STILLAGLHGRYLVRAPEDRGDPGGVVRVSRPQRTDTHHVGMALQEPLRVPTLDVVTDGNLGTLDCGRTPTLGERLDAVLSVVGFHPNEVQHDNASHCVCYCIGYPMHGALCGNRTHVPIQAYYHI